MKTVLRALAALVVGLLVLAGTAYLYASNVAAAAFARVIDVHRVDFPIPFPLSEDEIEALRAERRAAMGTAEAEAGEGDPADPLAGVDLDAIAAERALARAEHLLASRYPCQECHGADFGGGTMIDDPALGTLLGANITSGGRTASYTAADWDRIVRHGVLPDGHPAKMPAQDFMGMSDRELSDLAYYISQQPPQPDVVAASEWGPVGTILVATGQVPVFADVVGEHHAAHPTDAPPAQPDAAFGGHIARTCAGCHGMSFSGGPVRGGDPSWPPAANLTPHPDGLEGWTFEQFETVMRTATLPDGSELASPMKEVTGASRNFSDVEMQALWTYFSGLDPLPTGE